MIEFKNVSYTYANTQTPAVSDISFTVASGELKVVTGASGCGKTTLMRLANGLCPQIYGGRLESSVTVAGFNVSETPVADLSEVIGTLFQDPEEQFFALNAGDEIAFALRSRSFDPKDVRERTLTAARKLGIEELLTRDIHALSEGQKQKVGLAAILALGPKTLIFDEPSANLDPEATQALARTILELKKEGAAILVVDHRLYWLKEAADAVIVMSQGRIVEEMPFSGLYDDAFRARWGLRKAEVSDARRSLPRVGVTSRNTTPKAHDVFSASRIRFAYGDEHIIFDGTGFSVGQGVTALVGDNGTGKTTLARILTGLNRAQGNFYIGDQKVGDEGLMPFSGLVLQNADHQLQMRTVAEEVEGAIVAGRVGASKAKGWRRLAAMRPRPEDRARVQEILTSLNLLALAERHPQSLSGGEKQRLVIACAVAKDPAILILDEPTSGLDGANMAAIARLMREQADAGRAVFLVTHDLELLESCDRALVMTDLQKKCAG